MGIALVDINGHWMDCNETLARFLGYQRNELLARDFYSLTHPDDVELSRQYIGMLIEGKAETTSFEKRYIHKNGHTVWAFLSSSVVRDPQGKPLYMISQTVDITE